MKKAAVIGALALGTLAATAAFIQRGDSLDTELRARARVTLEQAREKALAGLPGGRITESELEEENGRLIYSFEIDVAGRATEVEIDAITGELLPPDADDDDDNDDDVGDDDDRKDGKVAR